MPCHPARARELLSEGRAAVFRRNPFTIIMKELIKDPVLQALRCSFDPGAKTTGVSIVGYFGSGQSVIWAAHLIHRSSSIKSRLDSRRASRRSRRARHTRYREPRFNNRIRTKGWLPPSIMSRVFNIENWSHKLCKLTPISSFAIETAKFDTQKMANPEISGVEYQQGTLQGYDVREYLLEKYEHQCVYCGKSDTKLEIDHVIPRSKGGTNSVNNLVIACHTCNQKKGNMSIDEFLSGKKLSAAKALIKKPRNLKGAAMMNATRYIVGERVRAIGLPVEFATGAQTKMNRSKQRYPKDHWIDASCIGEHGGNVDISFIDKPLLIKAKMPSTLTRGVRQVTTTDKYGFPKTKAKGPKERHGFRSGDFVKLTKHEGIYKGTYEGYITLSGNSFVLRSQGKSITASIKGGVPVDATLIQRNAYYTFSY